MPAFTYVTVSYCYVGVSYPVVGYADEGYWPVSYPVVSYRYVGESYCEVGYRGVWPPEMWRRTHRLGLTRGVAVDRMEVQQGGKRERKPQWTSKSTSSKSSAATTPQTWRTSWKTSKADPKAPAPAGASPSAGAPPEAREGPSEGRFRSLRGRPRRPGAGVCASGDGPEPLRNAGVAKIPELKM
jgi:hypothetical protein